MTLDDLTRGEQVTYFAYGSCMNQASLSASLECDVSRFFVGPAHLDGYRLAFNYASITEPVCCANIEADPHASLEGALYALPAALIGALDKREGVSVGRYARCLVNVRSKHAPVTAALSYRGIVTLPYDAAPSNRYRDILVQGLLDAGVSDAYRTKTIALMTSLRQREI